MTQGANRAFLLQVLCILDCKSVYAQKNSTAKVHVLTMFGQQNGGIGYSSVTSSGPIWRCKVQRGHHGVVSKTATTETDHIHTHTRTHTHTRAHTQSWVRMEASFSFFKFFHVFSLKKINVLKYKEQINSFPEAFIFTLNVGILGWSPLSSFWLDIHTL